MSTNNGINWINKNQGYNNDDATSLLILNGNIFAGTLLSSVWKRSLQEIINIKNISTNIPEKFELFQNYPNPFNPTTNIKYQITKTSNVKLIVFDILGREVETLVNEFQKAGTYEINFDAGKIPSGIYFYTMDVDNKRIDTKKMILIK